MSSSTPSGVSLDGSTGDRCGRGFAVTLRMWDAATMGESGNRQRKHRERMPKVPRGAEVNDIHLAGLTSSDGGTHSNRLDHDAASGRSEDINGFQRFVLRCLGRSPKKEETQ
jgi:hypothetical protein